MVASDAIALMRRHETKVRFVVAGGLNTLVGLAMFPVLYYALGWLALHYVIILLIAQAASTTFSFLTNKLLVFRTQGHYLNEYGKFMTFHIVHLGLNLIALPLLVEFGGLYPVVAQFLYSFVVIVTSYFWYSRITFHHRGA